MDWNLCLDCLPLDKSWFRCKRRFKVQTLIWYSFHEHSDDLSCILVTVVSPGFQPSHFPSTFFPWLHGLDEAIFSHSLLLLLLLDLHLLSQELIHATDLSSAGLIFPIVTWPSFLSSLFKGVCVEHFYHWSSLLTTHSVGEQHTLNHWWLLWLLCLYQLLTSCLRLLRMHQWTNSCRTLQLRFIHQREVKNKWCYSDAK